jgi:hypothetical protein
VWAALANGLVAALGAAMAAAPALLTAERERLILAQPPENPQSVLAIQKKFVAEKNRPDLPKERDVVVIGQVGGMPNVWPDTHPNFPFYPRQASFFLVDAKIAAQFAQHARQHGGAENCVFCRQLAAKNVNAIAIVNLVGADGKIVEIDSRELANLKENQSVTLRGKARLIAGNLLVIDADGIYVKPQGAIARTPSGSAR